MPFFGFILFFCFDFYFYLASPSRKPSTPPPAAATPPTPAPSSSSTTGSASADRKSPTTKTTASAGPPTKKVGGGIGKAGSGSSTATKPTRAGSTKAKVVARSTTKSLTIQIPQTKDHHPPPPTSASASSPSSSEKKSTEQQGQLWHKRVSAHQKAGVKAADGGEHSRGGLFLLLYYVPFFKMSRCISYFLLLFFHISLDIYLYLYGMTYNNGEDMF